MCSGVKLKVLKILYKNIAYKIEKIFKIRYISKWNNIYLYGEKFGRLD